MEVYKPKINESSPRDVLENLEKTGRYVFHGSSFLIKKFEPRQAFQSIKKQDGEYEKILDGDPAVFASPFVDTAIFMAVISRKNAPQGMYSGFSAESKTSTVKFHATQETMDQISEDASGYVYVFEKEKFQERNFNESVSYEEIEPVMFIEVTKKDLPVVEVKNF